MNKAGKHFLLVSLLSGVMISSLYLIYQVYDFRINFSEIERLNNKYEELSFRSNLLLSEVEYFRNQLTLREVATERLGMHSPELNKQLIVFIKN